MPIQYFKTQSHLCYRGCWHRFCRDYSLKPSSLYWFKLAKLILLSLAGSSFSPLPNIPHCCQGEGLFKKPSVAYAKDHWHGLLLPIIHVFTFMIPLQVTIYLILRVNYPTFSFTFLLGKYTLSSPFCKKYFCIYFTSMCYANNLRS